MTDAIFEIDSDSPVMIQGITGRMGRRHASLMRAYGTNVVGGTSARPEDAVLEGMQVFRSCREVVAATGVWASVVMVPPLEVLSAASEAIDAGVRLVVTIAEGVPVHDALRLKAKARAEGAIWLGASTPGMALPGRAKLGFLPDVALRPGSWALLTKSGTLSYEVGYRMKTRDLGQSIWIGVGGDVVKGVRFADLVAPLARHEPTRGVIVIGEVGGTEEEQFAEAIRAAALAKPVLALLAGRESKEGVSMGHAGAMTDGTMGTLRSKINSLRAAGAEVFESIEALINRAAELSDLSGQYAGTRSVHGA
ncbi:succinate--CoA ligase subunit alpha [Bradyrhizobium sp.]|uniref:succinate--CoA ligase subunit alpha n=1 Tax=Bradyrhizobium sp. TaxID=376 RepID=UPI003C71A436